MTKIKKELWDKYKEYNICVMGIPEVKKKEEKRSNIWSNNDGVISKN